MELIVNRYVWSFNASEGSDGETPVRVDRSDEVAKAVASGWYRCEAAPGTGSRTYSIVREDEQGAWGELVLDTMRELEPYEVV